MRISILGLVILSLASACGQKEIQETPQRPNIVFIMADDHAMQAISAYGHPISKLAPTPNIDRIAKNGALFRRSYVTNSICGPSRAVILTGKHNHINGFRQNGERFDGNQPTMPKYMQQLGYQTALMGKWHLHGHPQGFDDWKVLVDQGNYYNPDFIINGDTTRIQGYATDIITQQAIDWLEQSRKKDAPFMLMVQHKAPHRNWMPALRHTNLYDSISFPLPDSYFTDHQGSQGSLEQQQTIYKDMYEGHDLKLSKAYGSTELAHNPWKTDFERMTPEQKLAWDTAYLPKNNAFHELGLSGRALAEYKGQRYLQEYLATIAAVDEGVGTLLDYLETQGLLENTLVVYTSDQGFYLGEKGWFDKRYMYEESFGTPLLMQWPARIQGGQEIAALVQNLDFAQTFLEAAGGETYTSEMQGQSLLPLLDQEVADDDFRELLYYHYYDYPAFHMVKKHYGISTKRYKLMHFYDDIDSWEFYDLEQDPSEMRNAIEDPNYADVIQRMHLQLDSVQKAYGVTQKELEQAPAKKIDRAFENFKKLRGTPME
ncbi:MAG: sulfatase [Flavobacteriaceae bacterium]|nr:sulfatase [Flavobacteriaceae bacterium]MCI5087901.1 sulfatase [Flavobacteriaceae bacterium]